MHDGRWDRQKRSSDFVLNPRGAMPSAERPQSQTEDVMPCSRNLCGTVLRVAVPAERRGTAKVVAPRRGTVCPTYTPCPQSSGCQLTTASLHRDTTEHRRPATRQPDWKATARRHAQSRCRSKELRHRRDGGSWPNPSIARKTEPRPLATLDLSSGPKEEMAVTEKADSHAPQL